MIDRDELIADLLQSYRRELQALTDVELLSHWKVQRKMESMTAEEWQAVANYPEK